ncbi:uncharacterized WD repeat-containing protein alr3466-like [Eupeodes corollae]|uniref:uncharacterized WD repeat-containing protein alr3466-like n=1 Tax=Eupeodes corollae TaxID=290404 RepID=UPI0024907C3E|nr:uncharacterized WD repeat-containing protein alr3466-like [Eupeodes corollae]
MSKLIAKNVSVLQELKVHTKDVTCLEFWGNVLLVTGSSDKTIRIWKWEVGLGFVEDSNISPLLGHKYGVTSVKISPKGGVLASSSVDGTVLLWDISTGQKTNTLYQLNGEAVRSCCFSPNGSYIASADDSGAVCIWGQEKNLIRTLHYHEETVYALAFSADSSILLTACNTGMMRLTFIKRICEAQNHEYDCGIDHAHDLGVVYADFCKLIHTDPLDPDTTIHTVVTCGNDQCIKLWRIYSLKSNENLKNSRLIPPGPSERESGNSVVNSSSLMNAECVLTISGHGCSVTCVRFNSRGTLLISSGMDKAVKVWDLQGNCLQTLLEHSRYVNCVAINGDSSLLASGSNDRSVIVWDLSATLTLESHIAGFRSIIFNMAASEIDIPLELICPITHEIMTYPVVAEDGFTYEKSAILEWFDRGRNTSPMTNEELTSLDVSDNEDLKLKIECFLKTLDFDSFDGIA